MRRIALALALLLPSTVAAQTAEDSRRCGQVANRAGDPAAREHAERVIAEEPRGALAEFYRGCLAFLAPGGGAEKAAQSFERAVKLNDASGAAHDWLARAYGDRASSANPITQARLAPKIRSHFERAVALEPGNLEARGYLVQFYLQAPGFMGGSEQKAWAQIGEIRRLDAYRGGMLAAQTRYQRKDKPGALQEYEALAAQHPDSSSPMTGTASVASELGRFDRAFAAVDRMLARHPDSVYHHLVDRMAAWIAVNVEDEE